LDTLAVHGFFDRPQFGDWLSRARDDESLAGGYAPQELREARSRRESSDGPVVSG